MPFHLWHDKCNIKTRDPASYKHTVQTKSADLEETYTKTKPKQNSIFNNMC